MNKEEIIKMTKQAGFERLGHDEHDYVCYPDDIVAFARLVAEHEREKCAKVCDGYSDGRHANMADLCAEAIRARGEQE